MMAEKRKGHPHNALSAAFVRTAKPGRYADGNGLQLVVEGPAHKYWILRTVIQGTRTDLGLGSARLVPLADARVEAARLRRIAREGGDPRIDRKKAREVVPTFEEAARAVHEEHAAGWKNEKHAAQWIATLETYVFPTFGKRSVADVDTPDILKALSPIWLTRPETARRVRQRIGVVLDAAKAKGHRTGDNPIAGVTMGLPKQPSQAGHHAALGYEDVPGFIATLRETDAAGELAKLAFEFMIVTAARTSEVLLATWAEIDEDARAWNIPAERMKAKREHRVPLAPRAIAILKRARELVGADGRDTLIFPGRAEGRPMSNMVFLMILRRMGVETTGHGFRSSFSDWTAERTHFPADVREASLAHVIANKTEAAYRRGDLFEKRRELMNAWARHCEPRKRGDVVPMRAKGSAS